MQQMSRKNTMLARPQKVNLNHRGKSLAVAEESDELKASGSESISGRDTRSKDSGVGRAAADQRATMYNTVYNAGSKKRLLDEIDFMGVFDRLEATDSNDSDMGLPRATSSTVVNKVKKWDESHRCHQDEKGY